MHGSVFNLPLPSNDGIRPNTLQYQFEFRARYRAQGNGCQCDVLFMQYWKRFLYKAQSVKMALKALVGQSKYLDYLFIL
jgi:hypothetical protein